MEILDTSEIGNWKLEIGNRKSKMKIQESGVRNRQSGITNKIKNHWCDVGGYAGSTHNALYPTVGVGRRWEGMTE